MATLWSHIQQGGGVQGQRMQGQPLVAQVAAGCASWLLAGCKMAGSQSETRKQATGPPPSLFMPPCFTAIKLIEVAHLRRTPTSCSTVRVTTLTSATAHSEESASPRNPNVASSCV